MQRRPESNLSKKKKKDQSYARSNYNTFLGINQPLSWFLVQFVTIVKTYDKFVGLLIIKFKVAFYEHAMQV